MVCPGEGIEDDAEIKRVVSDVLTGCFEVAWFYSGSLVAGPVSVTVCYP
jgi:hypothetical protein